MQKSTYNYIDHKSLYNKEFEWPGFDMWASIQESDNPLWILTVFKFHLLFPHVQKISSGLFFFFLNCSTFYEHFTYLIRKLCWEQFYGEGWSLSCLNPRFIQLGLSQSLSSSFTFGPSVGFLDCSHVCICLQTEVMQ